MKPKVLIVEDQPDIAALLELAFREIGCETIRVSSGEDALRILKDEGMDLVTLDVQLPGIDGIKVLTRLRQEGVMARVAVIAGNITNDICREMWSNDSLTSWHEKPISRDEIVNMVKGLQA